MKWDTTQALVIALLLLFVVIVFLTASTVYHRYQEKSIQGFYCSLEGDWLALMPEGRVFLKSRSVDGYRIYKGEYYCYNTDSYRIVVLTGLVSPNSVECLYQDNIRIRLASNTRCFTKVWEGDYSIEAFF